MITVTQNGSAYEIRFPYDPALVELVKSVPGRWWHPEGKYWSVPLDKLGFFQSRLAHTSYYSQLEIISQEYIGVNDTFETVEPASIPDVDLTGIPLYVEKGSALMSHQKDTLKFEIGREQSGLVHGFILGDMMGCVDGNSEVWIKEKGKPATRPTSVKNLKKLIDKDPSIQIKCLVNGRFHYMPIAAVLDKGIRPTIRLNTETNSLICTPDHKIYTSKGWIEAQDLKIGDEIFTNGDPEKCIACGSENNLITDKYAMYYGYCKKCMYIRRRSSATHDTSSIYKRLNTDGYIELYGIPIRMTPLWKFNSNIGTDGGVYEHHYVWWKNTGHVVDGSIESIHHINHVKTDNRFENLQLLSISEHAKIHSDESTKHLPQNSRDYIIKNDKKIYYVPRIESITNIEYVGDVHVYDIAVDSNDIHNFVCNNIVVHNCGKTLQVINLALYNKNIKRSKHCLVIACINSAKHNWVSDIAKHTNGEYEGYLLGSRLNKKGEVKSDQTGEDKYLDLKTGFKYGNEACGPLPYFLIVNIEAFRYKDKKLKKNKDAFTCEVIHQIEKGNISMIALDEIHRNCSPTSQQGKAILKIKKYVQSKGCDIEWIPMTGTPIVNNPLDVFLPLKLVDGHRSNSYYEWSREFCVYGGYGGHDIISYKNIPKLKSMLLPNMLRRRREDILDLPPKIQMIEYVENTEYQKKLYASILADMNQHKDNIRVSLNPMTMFLRLRQVNGAPEILDNSISIDNRYLSKNAKIKRALELIDEIIANGEKVVVFSNWVETLKGIYKLLQMKKIKTCVYTGTMKQDVREQHKRVFQDNLEYRVIIGTIGALGTSHTLTAANNVIFLDEPWAPAVKSQAEDRCHRIGTTKSVTIYTLLSQNTVDDRVHDLLFKKQGSSDFIVDNMNDVLKNHPDLLDWLLCE